METPCTELAGGSMTIKDVYSLLGEELIPAVEIQKRISALCREIEDWGLPDGLTLVPILPGALFLCSEIQRRMKIPVRVTPFYVADRGQRSFYLHSMLDGKCLLVTDVIDSGLSLDIAGEAIDKYGAEEARILTLCHKGKVSMDNIFVHYLGFRVPKDQYIVGSGLDFQGLLGNLPGIRKLNV